MLLMSRARSASTTVGPPLSLFGISGAKPWGLLDTCQSDRGGKQPGLGYCDSAVRRLSQPKASSWHSHGNPSNKIMILQYNTNTETHFAHEHIMESGRTYIFLSTKDFRLFVCLFLGEIEPSHQRVCKWRMIFIHLFVILQNTLNRKRKRASAYV